MVTMENPLVYEHPLSERIRTLLRIENLFKRLDYYSVSPELWDVRLTVSLLIDLNDLLGWFDSKNDLLKELDRCRSVLSALQDNPGVDPHKLEQVLSDLDECRETLQDNTCDPGAALRKDELITSIKQKAAVAGGVCNFDLPAYHRWLNEPERVTQERLRAWQEDMLIIRKSAMLVLNLLRSNPIASKETAREGVFQQSVESGSEYRLIRVIVPRSQNCFPEISGGKHRVTIRFMEQAGTVNRPEQTGNDVEFQLHFCVS